jgi:uncharacterized membrane protein
VRQNGVWTGERSDRAAGFSAREGVSTGERWGLAFVLLFTFAGAGTAAYLLHLHMLIAGNPKKGLCTFTDTLSCDKVLASPYAEIAGIPVALIGLLGFAFLFGLAAWRLAGGRRSPRRLPGILALVAGGGVAFELVMTWVEFFIIGAACPYCLTAFACLTSAFVAALLAWRAAASVRGVEASHAR